MGPDDPVGAPANRLIESLIKRKLRFTLPVGFGCLDVRDFAAGVLAASERGRSGQRYLLSGHNVTTDQLLEQAAAVAGVRVPRFKPPRLLIEAIAIAVEMLSKVRGKPAPIDRSVLQIIGRYAWYDTTRARSELGWQPRPLQQTLEDTIRWCARRRGSPIADRGLEDEEADRRSSGAHRRLVDRRCAQARDPGGTLGPIQSIHREGHRGG